jgi:hypothetical protein
MKKKLLTDITVLQTEQSSALKSDMTLTVLVAVKLILGNRGKIHKTF